MIQYKTREKCVRREAGDNCGKGVVRMILKIDMSGETPIYIQLRNEIVKGIGRGELAPGENLPTVRQLALELGVNTMTVSKAYQLLKSEGFIATRPEKRRCGKNRRSLWVSRRQQVTGSIWETSWSF